MKFLFYFAVANVGIGYIYIEKYKFMVDDEMMADDTRHVQLFIGLRRMIN